MKSPRILMCPPTHFGIEYEINPWMNRFRPANRELAEEQWHDLVAVLEGSGATIELLKPVPGLPDMVFTANAALIIDQRAVLSNFRYTERQREIGYTAGWFRNAGFEVETLPEEMLFEGAGDALFCGDTLFAGYPIRSHLIGHHHIGEQLGCRVISLVLCDSCFYHLDTCFCPLGPEIAIWYPGAFDDYGRAVLREQIPELIAVTTEEAHHFACNAVVVGTTVVTNAGCPQLHEQLRAHGFRPVETPLSEFVKSGGSAKCLTLRLDGEEAAVLPGTLNSGLLMDSM